MNQKGNVALIVVGLIVILVAAFLFLKHSPIGSTPGGNTTTQVAQSSTAPSLPPASPSPVPTVRNVQDLNTVSNDLDNTNLNSIDNTISQNSSDSSGY